MLHAVSSAVVAAVAASPIWLSRAEIVNRPMTGAAWSQLVSYADQCGNGTPDASDRNNEERKRIVAAAIAYVRTGDESYRDAVVGNCQDVIGTEGGDTLSLGRCLFAYAFAAQLVDYHGPAFVDWIDDVRFTTISGRTLISTHEERPNNWGTWAGLSRLAVDVYIGDADDFAQAVTVWQGWFDGTWDHEYSSPFCWHDNDGLMTGINWENGVVPDDQRRCECCPPTVSCENYVFEALQGVIGSVGVMEHLGYPALSWWNNGLHRAWMQLDDWSCEAEGNDRWEPWFVNWAYGTDYPAPLPAEPGRSIGFTDWTHSTCRWDLDGDGEVAVSDQLLLLAHYDDFGSYGFLGMLGSWGSCP